ncbi:hypothetical protein CPB84DRAFT_1847070 [Gymnopilus junonius]|uniref:Uncharacterized protein n=1 Tax=Gymnopilus junonius TaxID=109634 RepID=A0A9P5NN06_GYMJU|nr:hypothetical protein CPB84DRAFT_1847070 [Gymnopilus junonius]
MLRDEVQASFKKLYPTLSAGVLKRLESILSPIYVEEDRRTFLVLFMQRRRPWAFSSISKAPPTPLNLNSAWLSRRWVNENYRLSFHFEKDIHRFQQMLFVLQLAWELGDFRISGAHDYAWIPPRFSISIEILEKLEGVFSQKLMGAVTLSQQNTGSDSDHGPNHEGFRSIHAHRGDLSRYVWERPDDESIIYLTVLVSPIPLYPGDTASSFPFSLRRPAAVPSFHPNSAHPKPLISPSSLGIAAPRPRRPPRDPVVLDSNLLTPPVNTWKAARPRHRPTRSQSAPPERRNSAGPGVGVGGSPTSQYFGSTTALTPTAAFNYNQPPLLLAGPRNTKRSFTSFTVDRQTTQGGELVRPPPPLRDAPYDILAQDSPIRSNRRIVLALLASYPAVTYVAAGLAFDAPVHDLSALCVESRVGFIVIPSDQSFQ